MEFLEFRWKKEIFRYFFSRILKRFAVIAQGRSFKAATSMAMKTTATVVNAQSSEYIFNLKVTRVQ